MKRVLLLIMLIIFGLSTYCQNASPVKMIGFHKISSGTMNSKLLKEEIGRDCDFNGNKAALIRVKPQGFDNKTMLDFTLFSRPGLEIIHKTYHDDEMWLYVSSGCQGTIVMKYMGEFEFKLPYELESESVYILVLGMEMASLVIRAVPAEAVIYVDNQRVGAGYANVAVAVGAEHIWKVQSDDYWPKEGKVYFDNHDEKVVNVELDPKFGYITVNSVPSGADVYIDDKVVGKTPYNNKRIKIGRHSVEVRKIGYESSGEVITIKSGEHNRQFDNMILKESEMTYDNIVEANSLVTPSKKSGVFSVSANQKVYFSCGNLQYQASTGIWRFAENQWDIAGEDNDNRSANYKGWIDLFYWGMYDKPNDSPTGLNKITSGEWKNYIIINGGGDSWRILTYDEWQYVFYQRKTTSGFRFAKAVVNGMNGIILLPDSWDANTFRLSSVNSNEAKYYSNTISAYNWENVFEPNGAVFLPAAGSYSGSSFRVGIDGDYWTTTRDNNSVTKWTFDDKFIGYSRINYQPALSVRLVSPCQ